MLTKKMYCAAIPNSVFHQRRLQMKTSMLLTLQPSQFESFKSIPVPKICFKQLQAHHFLPFRSPRGRAREEVRKIETQRLLGLERRDEHRRVEENKRCPTLYSNRKHCEGGTISLFSCSNVATVYLFLYFY